MGRLVAGLPEHMSQGDLSTATGWIGGTFDNAVAQLEAGNDRQSLANCFALRLLQVWLETAAAAEGLPRPRVMDIHWNDLPNTPYLGFLGNLPALQTDEARRVMHPRPAPDVLSDLMAIKDKQQRIAALIDALDEITTREWGFDNPPIVKALISEGEDAVDPLLMTFQLDNRLTRCVPLQLFGSFTSPCPDRNIMPVSDVARDILDEILDCKYLRLGKNHSREQLVDLYRDYWRKTEVSHAKNAYSVR